MMKAIQHVYGKCPCGVYHTPPKNMTKPKAIAFKTTPEGKTSVPLENTIWDTRTWKLFKVLFHWILVPLLFGSFIGSSFNNPSLGGVITITYFIFKFVGTVASKVWNGIQKKIKEKGK